MKLFKKSLLIFPIIFFFLQAIPVTYASDMAYNVKAKLPENQRNTGNTFFDLLTKAGQKQDLSITLTNNSENEETYIVTPNVATTNSNGVIEYNQTPKKLDSTLKVPFTEIVSEEQEVTLKAKESQDVIFTLEMPKESIKGVILGGFYVQKKSDGKKSESEQKVMIENKYAYVIGARIIEEEKESETKLTVNNITPGLINYRTAVSANIQNITPRIINGLSVDAYVTEKGNTTVLHQTKKDNLMMAPNSNFDYAVLWDNQELKTGTYTMHVKTTISELTYNESFEKDFKISSKDATKANKEAVELEKNTDYRQYLFISLGVLGFLIFICLIVYINQKKKKKEEELKRKLTRKRKKKKAAIKKKKEELQNKKEEVR